MLWLLLLHIGVILLFSGINIFHSAGVILTLAGSFFHMVEWWTLKSHVSDLEKLIENNNETVKNLAKYIWERGDNV